MMPLFLSKRQPGLVELMDLDDCNKEQLFNTYRQFYTINKWLSRWDIIYKREIRPLFDMQNEVHLLDIGFGGGDIPVMLKEMADKDGLKLHITAIETDPRALEFIDTISVPHDINFLHCSSSKLVDQGAKFDVVISNHLLHHLNRDDFLSVSSDARQLATHKVLFNDIERSDIGYGMYAVFSRLLFRNSFAVYDGSLSIKRSYTRSELAEAAPDGWEVTRLFPFRLLLSYTHDE